MLLHARVSSRRKADDCRGRAESQKMHAAPRSPTEPHTCPMLWELFRLFTVRTHDRYVIPRGGCWLIGHCAWQKIPRLTCCCNGVLPSLHITCHKCTPSGRILKVRACTTVHAAASVCACCHIILPAHRVPHEHTSFSSMSLGWQPALAGPCPSSQQLHSTRTNGAGNVQRGVCAWYNTSWATQRRLLGVDVRLLVFAHTKPVHAIIRLLRPHGLHGCCSPVATLGNGTPHTRMVWLCTNHWVSTLCGCDGAPPSACSFFIHPEERTTATF
jgi:hypothetical protein